MGKRELYSFGIIVLIAASILFAQRLLTAGYPTHLDVFYFGGRGWCVFEWSCGMFRSNLLVSISSIP